MKDDERLDVRSNWASEDRGIRFLQYVSVRLREAARRRAASRGEPPELHCRLQPEHARGAGEVRFRQHDQQARRGGAPVPGARALQERGPASGQDPLERSQDILRILADATRRTKRSESSATRSTSTVISTGTPLPDRSKRSRPTSVPSSRTSCGCWRR
jgi:hypothetical protein